MLSKVAGMTVAMAMVAMMSGSVSAYSWNWPSNDVSIKNDDIFVMTKTEAVSTTGRNDQWSVSKYGGDVTQKLTTGVALSDAFSGVSVASTFMPNCGCSRGDVRIDNDDIKVMTVTTATAKTGNNDQWSVAKGWGSDSFEKMVSGNAGSTAKSNIMVAYTDFTVGSAE